MADTVAITAGSGTTIATDHVSLNGVNQHVQYVKILSGADGGTGRLSVTTGGTLTITAIQGTAASLNAQVVGSVAHDAASSGNPVRVGLKARSTLSNVTAVASHDVTDAYGDLDGVLLTRTHVPLGQLLTSRVGPTTAAAATFSTFTATTLLRNYVTNVSIYNNSATAVAGAVHFLNGSTSTALFYVVGAPARTPVVLNFDPPLRQPSTNTALGYRAVNAAGSGVNISVIGFQSKL
jgi:hypothetical protein